MLLSSALKKISIKQFSQKFPLCQIKIDYYLSFLDKDLKYIFNNEYEKIKKKDLDILKIKNLLFLHQNQKICREKDYVLFKITFNLIDFFKNSFYEYYIPTIINSKIIRNFFIMKNRINREEANHFQYILDNYVFNEKMFNENKYYYIKFLPFMKNNLLKNTILNEHHFDIDNLNGKEFYSFFLYTNKSGFYGCEFMNLMVFNLDFYLLNTHIHLFMKNFFFNIFFFYKYGVQSIGENYFKFVNNYFKFMGKFLFDIPMKFKISVFPNVVNFIKADNFDSIYRMSKNIYLEISNDFFSEYINTQDLYEKKEKFVLDYIEMKKSTKEKNNTFQKFNNDLDPNMKNNKLCLYILLLSFPFFENNTIKNKKIPIFYYKRLLNIIKKIDFSSYFYMDIFNKNFLQEFYTIFKFKPLLDKKFDHKKRLLIFQTFNYICKNKRVLKIISNLIFANIYIIKFFSDEEIKKKFLFLSELIKIDELILLKKFLNNEKISDDKLDNLSDLIFIKNIVIKDDNNNKNENVKTIFQIIIEKLKSKKLYFRSKNDYFYLISFDYDIETNFLVFLKKDFEENIKMFDKFSISGFLLPTDVDIKYFYTMYKLYRRFYNVEKSLKRMSEQIFFRNNLFSVKENIDDYQFFDLFFYEFMNYENFIELREIIFLFIEFFGFFKQKFITQKSEEFLHFFLESFEDKFFKSYVFQKRFVIIYNFLKKMKNLKKINLEKYKILEEFEEINLNENISLNDIEEIVNKKTIGDFKNDSEIILSNYGYEK